MSRRLRTSKYKHTRGAEYKREQWYADIQVGDCGGDSNQIAASATYIAYPGSTGGGGSLSLLNVASVGKQSLENIFTVSGHSAKVTDFSFSPFADNVLATGSEDANIAVWELPEDGLTENVGGSPMAMLAGHGRRVEALEWNPVARNVIGSISQDRTLKIWDVAQSADVLTLDGFGEQPQAMCWNFEGSLVAATCKDKVVRLFDPRADGLVAEAPSHQGLKATRVTWMGDSPFFVTSGFSKMRKRELWVWDATAMDAPVKKISLDSSTGVLMPMYDADTKILVVTGKGDSGTRYYEFAPDANKTQYLYEIGTVAGTDPHSGACLLPKRSMSFMDCEVIRLLKLGSKDVLTVKFEVPRKSHSEYHPDIYPDTRGTEPACEADEWFAGDNNTVVPLIDLTPAVTRTYNLRDDPEPAATSTSATGASGGAGGSGPAAGPKIKPKKIVAKKWGSGGGSKWGSGNTAGRRWSRDQTAAAVAAREPQEEEDPMANMREVVVPKVVRTSKFRHVRGKGTKAEETFFDLRLSQVTTTECNLIQANQLFFCIPYAGAAGHLAIFPLDHPGKTPVEWPTFHHSAAFMDWAFNPFDDYMIGAGTEDAHVHIYRVPTADGLEETITSPAVDFSGHSRKVSVVHWHPLAENVLVSGSSDATVRIWDVESEQDRGVLDCFGDQVFDFAFSPRGDLMATASKDKTLRVVDPRSGEVSGEVQAHSALTAWKVHWSPDRDHIISVGYGRGSKREIKVWDPRSLAEPLYFKPLGLGSSYTISFYDPGTGIIFLGGKGDGNIKMFEYNDEGIHILPDYQSGSPQNGLAYLPKHACDVTQVEFARMMKLSVDVVEPLSFTVPRTRKEFFQDDLFPDCYPPYPTYSAGEWFDGETRDVELVSLQPEGMEKVSEQETERRPVRKWVPKTIEAADTRSTRDKLMGNFNNLIDDFASDEIPQDANEGVDAEEWTA